VVRLATRSAVSWARTGASFAANSVLLKFSRDAEREADLMGTQILFRITRIRAISVNQEITKLGGLKQPNNDSADFQRIKRILKTK
jgi:Zn-dependent protease with chaperone function